MEGQINPDQLAPVLPYATGVAEEAGMEWRRLPHGVELIVPPPSLARQLVVPAIELVIAILLFALLAIIVVAALLGGPVMALVIFSVMLWLVFLWGVRVVRRLVNVAKNGRGPTVIATSEEGLTLTSPWLPEERVYQLPRSSITALRFDDCSIVPAVVRFARLRVVLRSETLFDLRFPWRGDFALAPVEGGFREALGLGPRNFSPPVAGVTRATNHAQTDPRQARVAES